MSAMDAAVTLAKTSGWSLSNLQIQKLLYIAQMMHIGRHGAPIFNEDFEAWKLGPVLPGVYRIARMYGSKPVTNLFHDRELPPGTGKSMVEEMYNTLDDHSPWKLVSITHWGGGAWAKHYNDNEYGCTIPKADILNEYNARAALVQQPAA